MHRSAARNLAGQNRLVPWPGQRIRHVSTSIQVTGLPKLGLKYPSHKQQLIARFCETFCSKFLFHYRHHCCWLKTFKQRNNYSIKCRELYLYCLTRICHVTTILIFQTQQSAPATLAKSHIHLGRRLIVSGSTFDRFCNSYDAVQPGLSVIGLETMFDKRCSDDPLVHLVIRLGVPCGR